MRSKVLPLMIPLLLALSAVPVNAQQWIQNNQIRLTLGNGWNNQGPYTVVGMAPVNKLWRDIVWFGEYEYLSTAGPPNPSTGGSWPGLLVPLWGPTVARSFVGSGANWYSFSIGPVYVGGVPVTVVKTVTLPLFGTWGWARISYQILPLATISSLWLYYSIDYCDGPVTGSPVDNMYSWTYFNPLNFEPVSRQVPPAPMLTPPGGGVLVNTKGMGVGVLGSWGFAGGSRFPITRYCGYWYNGLYDTWPNNNIIIERDDDEAFAVNLGTVTAAGVVCDQIFIGEIFADPPQALEEEPSLASPMLIAGLDIFTHVSSRTIEGNHTVKMSWPIAGIEVTLDAQSSIDLNASNKIIEYEWIFEEGTEPIKTSVPVITHIYPVKEQDYNVTATVRVYNTVGQIAEAHWTFEVASGEVGGILAPVDKFDLLAPYVGLASTIVVVTVVTAVCVSRAKRGKEKQ